MLNVKLINYIFQNLKFLWIKEKKKTNVDFKLDSNQNSFLFIFKIWDKLK